MKFLLRKLIKTKSKSDREFYCSLKKILGFKPSNLKYYSEAFTHSSLKVHNDEGVLISYERLEFLGDAMLGSIIASYLFEKYPKEDEGYLTKMRSKIVSRENLNSIGEKINLLQFVKANTSKKNYGSNITGNIFEAFIGAIYLDKGYAFCEKFISKQIISSYVDLERLENKVSSYKSLIIEWCQKTKKTYKFDSYEDSGRQDQKHFSVKIIIDDKCVAKGRATSKKKAEELAARRVYFAFQNEIII